MSDGAAAGAGQSRRLLGFQDYGSPGTCRGGLMSADDQALVAPNADLTLTAPEPVAAVAPPKAAGMVPIDASALPALDEKVAAYVESIVSLDVHSPAFSQKASDVRQMGDADIKASADTSNRLLASPVRAMQK